MDYMIKPSIISWENYIGNRKFMELQAESVVERSDMQHPILNICLSDLNHSTVFFFQADAGSYYTAWSSASSLVGRGLMIRKGHPPR